MPKLIQPGTQVYITMDCREGGPATGQIGTYEGDFPLTVAFGVEKANGEFLFIDGEYSYQAYKDGLITVEDGRAAKDVYPEWKKGQPRPAPLFAMVEDNPRIRLSDGSVIWGCECWWGEVEGGTFDKAVEATHETIKGINAVMKAIKEKEIENKE